MSSPIDQNKMRQLQNLPGRRRISRSQIGNFDNFNDLQYEQPTPDINDTAQPQENLPLPDEEGGISPESYDVRANKVMVPQTQQAPIEETPLQQPQDPQEEGYLSKIGKYLGGGGVIGSLVQRPQEKQIPQPQAQEAQPIPQQVQPQDAGEEGYLSKIGKYINNSGYGGIAGKAISAYNEPKPLMQAPPAEKQNVQPQISPEQEVPQEQQIPSVPPSKVYQKEEIRQAVEDTFGVKIDDSTSGIIDAYGNVINDIRSGGNEAVSRLTEQEKEIRDRIKGNELSTQDKIFMGLALLAPAFVAGAMGGKEALFAGLAGGTEGLAKVLGQREERGIKDQDKLSEVALAKNEVRSKAGVQEEKILSDVKKMIDAIPGKELKDRFMRDGFVSDKGKLLLDTGNPYLPARADAMKTEGALKRYEEKVMPVLTKQLSGYQEQQRISESLHSIADWQRNKDKNEIVIYDPASKAAKSYFKILGDNFEDPETGNKIKVSAYIDFLQNEAINAFQKFETTSRAFGMTKAHEKDYLSNPYSFESFLAGKNSPDTLDQQTYLLDGKYFSMLKNDIENNGGDSSILKKDYENTPYMSKIREKKETKKLHSDRENLYLELRNKQGKEGVK